MAAKPINIHPAALEEWKSATVWYVERNETAAINFVAEPDQAIDLIAASPQRWTGGLHGTRKFVLRRFPYAIVYREQENFVQILAIAHGNRRPGHWKNRL